MSGALENLGVQSLRRGGGKKSLHPHIIPCKRREAGCASAGTAARNERVGVSLIKKSVSSRFLTQRYFTYSTRVTVHPDASSCKMHSFLKKKKKIYLSTRVLEGVLTNVGEAV